MNELIEQLQSLKLHGMAKLAPELLAKNNSLSLAACLKQLMTAEQTERETRSINYQMHVAKFPHHKDLTKFNYDESAVDQSLIEQLALGEFTQNAQNIIFIGGTGTGKTHLATALGIALIKQHKKGRFFNAVDFRTYAKQTLGERNSWIKYSFNKSCLTL